ncbi:hypothetical protein ABT160_25975 [Streptomyces sp. NPDC001941]|uniref:hypothetical protein n=1 Tax=Streptomyces sp. NPDC001941 TaxID=3154659 RepID=UPI00332F6A44
MIFLSQASACEEFVTTRAVARRALVELTGSGLLEVVPGKGRVVRGLPGGDAPH